MERMRTVIKTLGHPTANLYMYIVGESVPDADDAHVAGEKVQLWKNQALFSLRNASDVLHYSKNKIARLLKKLVEFGLIKVQNKPHFTIITLSDSEGQQRDNKPETQPTTATNTYSRNTKSMRDSNGTTGTETGQRRDSFSEQRMENMGQQRASGGSINSIIDISNEKPNEECLSFLREKARKMRERVKSHDKQFP